MLSTRLEGTVACQRTGPGAALPCIVVLPFNFGIPFLPPTELIGYLPILATTRLAISTPAMLGWFRRWNAVHPRVLEGSQKPYAQQVKSFNFLHHGPLAPGFRQATDGGNAERNLVAPYGERQWWVNLHQPGAALCQVMTCQTSSGDPSLLVGRSYADLIAAHPFHPEAKSVGLNGLP